MDDKELIPIPKELNDDSWDSLKGALFQIKDPNDRVAAGTYVLSRLPNMKILDGCDGPFFYEMIGGYIHSANEDARRNSLVDPLTGLYNRRAFDKVYESIQKELGRNGGKRFSFLTFDIDHFKKFNDTYGHLAGDKVLKDLAEIVAKSVRPGDKVFRLGGEEFAVLYADADLKQARSASKNLRNYVANTKIEFQDEEGAVHRLPVTFSGGITYINEGESMDGMFSRADKGLYSAKESGRNMVCKIYPLRDLSKNFHL